jgi:signal transduction histidine kinase
VDLVAVLVFYFPEQRLSALIIAVVVFRTMFYLLVGYAINRLVRELRQQNIDLEKANRRLSNFALVNEHLAVSRERNRLARELHDTLAHTLSGQAVQLEAVQTLWDLNPEQARTRLAQVLNQTRQGLKETRRAIQSLRASPLEDLGLAMALEQLLCSAGDRAGFQPILEMPETPIDLPGELEHVIYRVAEEAIRNIEQHARAGKVRMTLKNSSNSFEMDIVDDGVGFDMDMIGLEHRFGLLGMSERAGAVGGDLQITSQPEKGTVVRLRVEA